MEAPTRILRRPTYVLNIIYVDNGKWGKGIYLSKRIQKNKEMYNLWQSPGGKVERGESSVQATIRETLEETGIKLEEEELTFLFNDPNFNCDVYITELALEQEPQHTEPHKQGPWELFTMKEYQQMALQKRTTPTHTEYLGEILQSINASENAYVQQAEYVQDALFGEAEVFDEQINILIDSGAIGCIISKQFLDRIGKPIDAPTNVQIIDVNGRKSAPLGIVRQVPIKMGEIITYLDMIVTESNGYNVLLGNIWLKLVKANINYRKSIMSIEYKGVKQTIPITCIQRMDPNQFVLIDPTEELELEEEEEESDTMKFCNAMIKEEQFVINEREYPLAFMEYCTMKYPDGIDSTGPSQCLCQMLDEGEKCKECDIIAQDQNIYTAIKEEDEKTKLIISLEEGKDVPIGQLEQQQNGELNDLLTQYKDLFAKTMADLRQTDIGEHVIITENVPPIKRSAYRAAPKENEFIKSEIDEMLQQGLVQPSKSPWSFPVVIVKKKNGKLRFCVNYKPLNDITKKDNYPLPRIDEIFDSLNEAQWFTTLDLASGYWQIKVREEDQEKTAFITKYGTYEFKVMPFGLCNAPATFQRTMDYVLGDAKGKFVMVYLDDVIIYSKTFEEHLKHIEEVLNRIRDANLRLKAEKCFFAATELQFLGHVVGKDGVRPDPEKVDKVVHYPTPTNLRDLRGVLGLFSYYRRFIKDFSQLADPLYVLLKKDAPYNWTTLQQKAFDALKEKLTQAPVVRYPDFSRPFFLYTDASGTGLGAVLAQKEEEEEYVIAYASRTLTPAEKNYAVTEMECLAIVWAVKYFRHYLYGSKFTIITDHSALKWLLNSSSETANKRLERWKISLSEHTYDVVYRKGTKHSNADALSRINETTGQNFTPQPNNNNSDHE